MGWYNRNPRKILKINLEKRRSEWAVITETREKSLKSTLEKRRSKWADLTKTREKRFFKWADWAENLENGLSVYDDITETLGKCLSE